MLGALSDGLGQGIDELTLKATLDGFASIAFAASLGWGWRLLPCRSGSGRDCSRCWQFCWDPSCPMLWSRVSRATGGVLLLGVGLRLLNIKAVPVGDMLPALILAPVLTAGVMALT